MKETLIATLRDKNTSIDDYRVAADRLAGILAEECGSHLEKVPYPLQTPIASTTGYKLKNGVILISILRSGLTLLPAFLRFFPSAKIGCIGLHRDEETSIAHKYYQSLPKIEPTDDVIILEPMIATGGSGTAALALLKELGIKEEKIFFVSVIAAPEGIQKIQKTFPKVKLLIAQTDDKLNADNFIVPGLGDFGDRFFGTV